MEERMRSMEDMFTRRLMRVVSQLPLSFVVMIDDRLLLMQMEHNEEKMDAKLDMIQRSRLLTSAPVPRSEGGYSDSIADSVESDAIGQLRMSDVGEAEYDEAESSIAGVRILYPLSSA